MKAALDQIDFAIVELLQKNARLSNKELAARVNLSPSSCLERVRRLQAAKVFRGFHAEVALEALGCSLQAMINVRLRRHTRRDLDSFRAHLLDLPEVMALYHIGGAFDFVVHVAVRDSDHLRDLALDAFTTRPEVGQLETHLIFETTRSMTLPVPPAASEPERDERRARPGSKPKGRGRAGHGSSR
jgi:DNA-binding Lrp family transcriptional regulator